MSYTEKSVSQLKRKVEKIEEQKTNPYQDTTKRGMETDASTDISAQLPTKRSYTHKSSSCSVPGTQVDQIIKFKVDNTLSNTKSYDSDSQSSEKHSVVNLNSDSKNKDSEMCDFVQYINKPLDTETAEEDSRHFNIRFDQSECSNQVNIS